MLNCILCDYLGNVNSSVRISPRVECLPVTLAGVGMSKLLLWLAAVVVCAAS